MKDFSDNLNLLARSWYQHHSVGRNALVLSKLENALRQAILIDEQPSQSIAGGSSLSKTQLRQPALAGEYLR